MYPTNNQHYVLKLKINNRLETYRWLLNWISLVHIDAWNMQICLLKVSRSWSELLNFKRVVFVRAMRGLVCMTFNCVAWYPSNIMYTIWMDVCLTQKVSNVFRWNLRACPSFVLWVLFPPKIGARSLKISLNSSLMNFSFLCLIYLVHLLVCSSCKKCAVVIIMSNPISRKCMILVINHRLTGSMFD